MTDEPPPTTSFSLPGWPRERPRAAAGRDPLSVDQIVEAAIRVIDAEGLDALSMRRLGAELDAGATSLYWHVKDKDELLDLVVDAVIGMAPFPPDEGTWRDRLVAFAMAIRGVLLEHRNAVPLFGSRATLGPAALTFLDWIIGVLDEAGFDDQTGAMAYQAYVNHVVGYLVLEVTQASTFAETIASGVSQEDIEREFVALMEALPADRFPNVVTHARGLLGSDDEARFRFGLERLLDGMERYVELHPAE